MQRQRDFTGGRVLAFTIAVQLAGFLEYRPSHEPVCNLALQLRGHRQLSPPCFSVGLSKRGFSRGNVASVAINDKDALKSMARQGKHYVAHHRQQGARLQAHGAWKAQVMFRHAEGLGWCNQNTSTTTHLQRDGISSEGIGADGAGRTMLFSGAERNNDAFAALQIGLNFRPTAQL